jgi:hypothetical protein
MGVGGCSCLASRRDKVLNHVGWGVTVGAGKMEAGAVAGRGRPEGA